LNLKNLNGLACQLTFRSFFLLAALALAACNMEGNSAQLEAQYPLVGSITELPDFAAIKDIKSRKKAFFDFLRPIVISENAKVAKSRLRMLDIATRLDNGDTISQDDVTWLAWLADKYHIDMPTSDDEQAWILLKRRVDTVPFRLALAQAANESSWGTSRFAREGRNLFGEWCFKAGCGIVPARRVSGMSHEVAIFDSINASVASYLYHLNRVDIYKPLRITRHESRRWGKKPTAHDLAAGLAGYSERGEGYVDDIRRMIRVNYDLMAAEKPTTTSAG